MTEWRGSLSRFWAALACLGMSLLVHALALQAQWVPRAVGGHAAGSELKKNKKASLTPVRLEVAKPSQGVIQTAKQIASPEPASEPAVSFPVMVAAEQTPSDDWDSYLPRPLLTLPPQARSTEPVLLEWPIAESALEGESDQATLRYVGVLALYIDEVGLVRFVRPQGDALPDVLAQAAIRAFVGLHFSPGELNGEPVRSRIFVEVTFERPEAQERARGLRR